MIRLSTPQVSTLPQGVRHFAELTSRLGTPEFPVALLDYLGQWANCQHFSVLRMDGQRPQLLSSGTRHQDASLVLRCGKAYIERYYRYDPLFEPLLAAPGQVGHLLAQDIRFMPYRESIYQRNGMIERLSSLYLDEQARPVLFNLYRHRDQGFFSDGELEMCESLNPSLLQLLRGHLALTGLSCTVDHHQQLLQRCPDLTTQELNICSRLLRGMSHAGIAADLAIKESTVKTYRNRAFDRLGIHFRSQLFALFSATS
ncbi:helix-turn-helix transcriptional regulator [Pseudomonas lactucae]|uniref:Helix-turn-helix transcriptional regulator n=1 Tax=Pseudomonas lactucae TaxID=2813360 RepID=A0A9X0YCH8_9PSED|nr:helix-turn-helix transcriptional regulator [Pseudomonas lactucae]MBN2976496.1 helix-turn-helix transcriptional regulator [Pseudomonas lactucae]MBN2987789.1 helix-turn-helix transcriptional regulator [Pseudomonas lactucae]